MSKSSKQNRKTQSSSHAQSADIHDLYQQSVQAPEADIEFFTETYEQLRGKKPLTMREDFCGTALLSVEWCRSDPERLAFGVDLSQETLDWGREHNIIPAGESVAQRITLRHGNVLDPVEEKVDITCALNFSYCIFKTRGLLRQYFENARAGLAPDGILVLDLFGGTETIDILEEERDVDDADFTYVWDQDRYNPITNEILCYIHFNFPDGSKLERAFTYDWRLWTIPEVRELLTEAGFSKVHVYWEEFEESDDEDDDELEGTGRYQDVEEVENQESWVIYIVAER